MNKSTFFIVGKHAVVEALKNPNRKVLRVFLTEESKKNIHRENQNINLLKNIKVHFKIAIKSNISHLFLKYHFIIAKRLKF